MWIEELFLQDFRNYTEQRISLAPHMNLILGNNGEGKTNLLEAMLVLATTRSHRTSQDKDLVRFGAQHFYLACKVRKKSLSGKVEIGYSLERRQKLAKLSGVVLSRLSDIVGELNLVLFSPEDLDLVKGSPNCRRRFVDILLSQIDRSYLHALQKYNRILAQRNECLRHIQSGRFSLDILDTWDEQLVGEAYQITTKREVALEVIGKMFGEYSARISSKEKLTLRYTQALTFQSGEELLKKLRASRQRDVQRGFTPAGPHRDDLLVLINGRPAANYASQGQQRTAVLALKLAELEFLRHSTGETPILLLDDVFSELDNTRRQALVGVLSGEVQSMLTGTREDQFSLLTGSNEARIFQVEQGKVI
jgi:DNA replication and repair protein RecF